MSSGYGLRRKGSLSQFFLKWKKKKKCEKVSVSRRLARYKVLSPAPDTTTKAGRPGSSTPSLQCLLLLSSSLLYSSPLSPPHRLHAPNPSTSFLTSPVLKSCLFFPRNMFHFPSRFTGLLLNINQIYFSCLLLLLSVTFAPRYSLLFSFRGGSPSIPPPPSHWRLLQVRGTS